MLNNHYAINAIKERIMSKFIEIIQNGLHGKDGIPVLLAVNFIGSVTPQADGTTRISDSGFQSAY